MFITESLWHSGSRDKLRHYSEFELLSRYDIQFRFNNNKGMNRLIPPAMS